MRLASWIIMASLLALAGVATGQGQKPPMPPGHPDVAGVGMGGMGGMPAGHPPMMPPATNPSTHGKITVRLVQGTQGGPAIGEAPLKVQLWHQQKVFRELDARTDKNGVAVIDQVPLNPPFQANVMLTYAGAEYSGLTSAMDSLHPEGKVDVTVYESTTEAPAWRVGMRHLRMERTEDGKGIFVWEMMAIENPSDKAWLGEARADGARVTLSIPLPPGARDLQVGRDLHQCCSTLKDGKLVTTQALLPAMTMAEFAYVVPLQQNKASVSIVAPAPVKHMIAMVAADGTLVEPTGMESQGAKDTREGQVQMFMAQDIGAGFEARLLLTTPARVASSGGNPAKVIAIVGVVLILLIGAGIVLFKGPAGRAKTA